MERSLTNTDSSHNRCRWITKMQNWGICILLAILMGDVSANTTQSDTCVYRIYSGNDFMGLKFRQLTFNPFRNSGDLSKFVTDFPEMDSFAGQFWLLEKVASETYDGTRVPTFKIRSVLTGGYIQVDPEFSGHLVVKNTSAESASTFLFVDVGKATNRVFGQYRDRVAIIGAKTRHRVVQDKSTDVAFQVKTYSGKVGVWPDDKFLKSLVKKEGRRYVFDQFIVISTNCSRYKDAFSTWVTDTSISNYLRNTVEYNAAVTIKKEQEHSETINKKLKEGQQCYEGIQCMAQAVIGALNVGLPTCDGATLCKALKDASKDDIDGWIKGGGNCGYSSIDPKAFLLESLGCGAALALAEDSTGIGNSIYSKLCTITPDQLVKQVTASAICGTATTRKSIGIAACPAGLEPATPEFIQKLQTSVFSPVGPQCAGCPAGYERAKTKEARIFDKTCYKKCEGKYPYSAGAYPSECFAEKIFGFVAVNGPSVVRDKKEQIVKPRDVCPSGYKAQYKLATSSQCMPVCNGLSIGEHCFGIVISPEEVSRQKFKMPQRFIRLQK